MTRLQWVLTMLAVLVLLLTALIAIAVSA